MSRNRHKQKSSQNEINAMVRPLVFGLIVGGITCFISLLLLAVIMSFKDVPNAVVTPLSTICAVVGAFFAGLVASKMHARQGYLIGIMAGVALFIVIIIAAMFVNPSPFTVKSLVKVVAMGISGAIGGMFGVNMSEKRRI